MLLPKPLKNNSVYPRVRAALLSLIGPIRFYNPISAASWCDIRREKAEADVVRTMKPLRRENGLTIWTSSRVGDLAATEAEELEHVAYLVAQMESNVYTSGNSRVKPGDVVLDVGANIGLFTKQAIQAGAQRVVCLEPTPATVSALHWNLQHEITANRVSVITKAAWDAIGTVRFTVDPKRPSRNSCVLLPVEEAAYEISVSTEPIDSIVRKLNLPRVDFIKMDIEGAELKALRGAADVLRRYQPQLAIAVEHTSDPLRNAESVRELVFAINGKYRCQAGPYMVKNYRLAPEILYFS